MKPTCDDLKPCPNPACRSERVCVADRCNYVICLDCHMTGPTGQDEERAVKLWNSLPRLGPYQYCEKCGEKLEPEYYHYCMEESDDDI